MDLWGMCPDCERWFSLPMGAGGGNAPEWSCPNCGKEPDRLHNRAARTAEPAGGVTG